MIFISHILAGQGRPATILSTFYGSNICTIESWKAKKLPWQVLACREWDQGIGKKFYPRALIPFQRPAEFSVPT